jgi:type VII secretion-associated serine protease mycosin
MLCPPVTTAARVTVSEVSSSSQFQAVEWWIQRWGLREAWKITKGTGVVVGVIDNGVQANLPDLAGAVVPGVDLTGARADGRTDLDRNSHGTAVAALVAAGGAGRTGMVGVAPEATVLPIILADGQHYVDPAGLGTARAIRWAVDHGAKVVNMSYGADDLDCVGPLLDAVFYAIDRNVVLVAGAGNDGSGINRPQAPARCPGVLAVGAIDEQGLPWQKTQRQPYVDVAGPGSEIVSIDKFGMRRVSEGTSDAAALVSGVVALLRARFPEMPARQIVTRLLATAKDAGAPGRDDQTGYGIVRPLNALTEDVPADAPNPVYEEVDRLRAAAGTQAPAAPAGHKDSGNLPLAVGLGAAAAGLTALVMLLVWRRRRSRYGTPMPHGWRPP